MSDSVIYQIKLQTQKRLSTVLIVNNINDANVVLCSKFLDLKVFRSISYYFNVLKRNDSFRNYSQFPVSPLNQPETKHSTINHQPDILPHRYNYVPCNILAAYRIYSCLLVHIVCMKCIFLCEKVITKIFTKLDILYARSYYNPHLQTYFRTLMLLIVDVVIFTSNGMLKGDNFLHQ